ncbi:MAG: carboxypeptidase regulatory-like domain-containing protein [Actinomycetota bacterium]
MGKKFLVFASILLASLLVLLVIYGLKYGNFLGTVGQDIVFGTVSEDAVSPQPVKNAKVIVGDKSTTTDERGKYVIKGVSPGPQRIVVEAEKYERYEKDVKIGKGRNKADILLSLTPDETMKRWLKCLQLKRFDEAYEYLHPEDKALTSKAKYVKYWREIIKKGIRIKEIKVQPAKILKTWTNPLTKKTYPNVAEMKTSLLFGVSKDSKKVNITFKWNTHLVKVGNQWKGFWVKPKR